MAFSWACLPSSHSKHCNISRNQPNGIICTHHTNSRLSRSKFHFQSCYRHLFIISHSPFMPSISKGIRDFSCQFEIPQTCLAVRKQALNIDTTHEHSSIKARWSRFTVPHLSSLYFSQLPTISPLPQNYQEREFSQQNPPSGWRLEVQLISTFGNKGKCFKGVVEPISQQKQSVAMDGQINLNHLIPK